MAFQDVTPGFGSVSTNGRMIAVAATATPGTTLHTHAGGTTTIDSVTVYAVNNDTTARTITIELGGTSASDLLTVGLDVGDGLVMVLRGGRINNGLSIAAFADAANVINCKVEVDTIQLT